MHQSVYAQMERLVKKYLSSDKELKILDIGSLDVNGSYRKIFNNPLWTYVGADASPGPNVEIVLDWEYKWDMIKDESFDVVISGQTFEHMEAPWLAAKSIYRICKKGGLCFISAPAECCYHEYPKDCWRIYPDGMTYLMTKNTLFVQMECILCDNDTVFAGIKNNEKENKNLKTTEKVVVPEITINSEYLRLCQKASDINEHLPTLKEYASRCSHVTEFGIGNSTYAFLSSSPKKMVSFDIVSKKPIDIAIQLAVIEGIDYKFIKDSTLVVDIEETDMLFIDTLHTFEQMRQELNRHSSKVKKWIILHDTETFGKRGENGEIGIMPAVEGFLILHPEWSIKERFYNNNGLTILERKNEKCLENKRIKVGLILTAYIQDDRLLRLWNSIKNNTNYDLNCYLYLHSGIKSVVDVCDIISKDNRVKYFPYGVNRGLSLSWNDGLIQSYKEDNNDVTIILNDDLVFGEGDFDRLVRAAYDNPDKWFVTANGLDENNNYHEMSWACFILNKIALEKIGYFDENIFPAYYEDKDYHMRAVLAGLGDKWMSIPSTIRHLHNGSRKVSEQYTRQSDEALQLNGKYISNKWSRSTGKWPNYKSNADHPFDCEEFGFYIGAESGHSPYPGHNRVNPFASVKLNEKNNIEVRDGVKKNICVITAYSDNYSKVGDFTASVNKKYCDKQGYDFRVYREGFDTTRDITWSKILFIRDAFKDYEYVFWIDADAVFVNHNVRIESFIKLGGDLFICKDYPRQSFNAGTMILRRCDWSFWLLDEIWKRSDLARTLWHEQDALRDLIMSGSVGQHLVWYPHRSFNGFTHVMLGLLQGEPESNFKRQRGDFVAHCTGGNIDKKFDVLKNIIESECNL